jgi:hypothetical protein
MWQARTSFFVTFFLMAFLCVSQQGEFKKTTKLLGFGGKSMPKTFCKKNEGEKTCFLSFLPSIFFIAFFGRFSA